MDAKNRGAIPIRVLLFPWLAHGHITPFMELAKKLSNKNFDICLCSTHVNLVSIKHNLVQLNFPSIKLLELHLPSSPDLPSHYHTTNGLPFHLKDTLIMALDKASSSFYNILTTIKPDVLICDFLQPWAASLASSLNIPTVQFLVVGTIANYHLVSSMKNYVFPLSCNHVCDDYANDHLLTFPDRIVQCLERSSKLMLVKSFREIEGKYIDDLSVLTGKKIVPVGPLVQAPSEETDETEKTEIIEWLNKKDPSSVVFVSFGSEFYLSKEDREELAYGLLHSEVNFIWVLRVPKGEELNIQEALPKGCAEKIGAQGLLVEDWAPQKRILGHKSIGGFLSHCGWGSVTESMSYGVPLIAMPMYLDQPAHARLVVEVGVGLEIKRNNAGRIERKEVEEVIKEVVVEKHGEKVRRRAKEIQACIRENGDKGIDDAAEELIKLCSMD